MKKIACVVLVLFFFLMVFSNAALCGDAGKTEHDKYLENGRFKVGDPSCDKSDKNCNNISAFRKYKQQRKIRDDSKVKNCPSCVPAKNSLAK